MTLSLLSKVKMIRPGLQTSQELWDLSESVWPTLAESVVTHPETDIWATFQHHCWIIMLFPKALSRQISMWGCQKSLYFPSARVFCVEAECGPQGRIPDSYLMQQPLNSPQRHHHAGISSGCPKLLFMGAPGPGF